MRLSTDSRPRPGIILVVVLAMLTLLALVGISFVLVADAARPANQVFRADVDGLADDTWALAGGLFAGLTRLEDEPVDAPAVVSALRGLSERAADLQTRVRAARDRTDDREARADLQALDRDLGEYRVLVCQLRDLIDDLP